MNADDYSRNLAFARRLFTHSLLKSDVSPTKFYLSEIVSRTPTLPTILREHTEVLPRKVFTYEDLIEYVHLNTVCAQIVKEIVRSIGLRTLLDLSKIEFINESIIDTNILELMSRKRRLVSFSSDIETIHEYYQEQITKPKLSRLEELFIGYHHYIEKFKFVFSKYMSNLLQFEDNSKRYIHRSLYEKMEKIIPHLQDVRCITGNAGTGKTEYVIEHLKDKNVMVISLANIVSSNFKKRFVQVSGKDCISKSLSAVKYLDDALIYSKNHETSTTIPDAYVIDEISLMGSTFLDTFIKILNMNRPVYVMGDIEQLPCFLGNGSILYEFITPGSLLYLGENVIHLTKNYRQINHPELFKTIQSVLNNKMPDFDHVINNDSEIENILKKYKNSMVITGSQKSVNLVTFFRLREAGAMIDYDDFVEKNDTKMVGKSYIFSIAIDKLLDGTIPVLPVILKTRLEESAGRLAGFPTKSFFLAYLERGVVKLISSNQEQFYLYDNLKFRQSFDPCYSMTAHSAQGLEFDNCIVLVRDKYDLPLRNKNGLYVAVSRSKSSTVIIGSSNFKDDRLEEYHFLNLKK